MPRTNFHINKDNPVKSLFAGFSNVNEVISFLFFEKNNKAQKIVHNFKYYGNDKLAEYMGRLAALELKEYGAYASIGLIVPVPLHRRKERTRGYNQSEFIARGFASVYGCCIDTKSVVRTVYTDSQTKKNTFERHLNVDGIFTVKDATSLTGQHILLIDDVITTGATTLACLQALQTVPDLTVSIFSLAATLEN
jgi:ComF family protein